ncbi:MAG: hypothetical protein WC654_06055 [Patescibacteria group bacterium]
MGKKVLSNDTYVHVKSQATRGGTTSATQQAEERASSGLGLDPLVDPKGPSHLGPVRLSLPRFEKSGKFWMLTRGIPMFIEDLLDTTGSMGTNVEKAFEVLPLSYEMLTSGARPILGRYDVQIATGIFNDVEDLRRPNKHVLGRTQFEMDEKIAVQMTLLVPGKGGCANGKEDPQFGLFGAAYLTKAKTNEYGLRGYHFTISDEPIVPTIDLGWLRRIFGDDVLARVKETGHNFDQGLPDTAQVVKDLQKIAHAFFLQVSDSSDVTVQWTELYGADHTVMLPGGGTQYLHFVKAVIIGLTEGTLDLSSALAFLTEHKVDEYDAKQIIRAVSHIPMGVQTLCSNFDKLPKAGDLFLEKTDLWPVDPSAQEDSNSAPDCDSNSSAPEGIDWL